VIALMLISTLGGLGFITGYAVKNEWKAAPILLAPALVLLVIACANVVAYPVATG
jgi:hypothetical protein